MTIEYRIVSIGTTSHNLVWGEQRPVRTQHATTTLIVDGERRILVDPSLPGQILTARLFERTGQGPESITDVFCTTMRPDGRRGLEAFPDAAWWAHEEELEWYGRRLEELRDSADRLEDEQAKDLAAEGDVIAKFRPAPERLGDQTQLYPLRGATPGSCGLLLTPATQTVAICGPAAATADHVAKGMIWEQSADADAAKQSLQDILEIADVIVPGFDNIFFAPGRWF